MVKTFLSFLKHKKRVHDPYFKTISRRDIFKKKKLEGKIAYHEAIP